MTTLEKRINEGIDYARDGDYLQALNAFLEIYGSEDEQVPMNAKTAKGLSYFGLSLALVRKKYKEAIGLCKRAIELEFYNGDNYVNLTRVYVAAGNRKKALETAESGLKLLPDYQPLLAVRRSLGIRSRPAIPFLGRSHPLNVSLGQARHARKVAKAEEVRAAVKTKAKVKR